MSDASDTPADGKNEEAADTSHLGTSGWMDLTVPNASEVRDFYQAVIGWQSQGLDMGGYEDYVMTAPKGDGVAGVCHARGVNADIPPVWLIYWYVADLDASLAACRAGGGAVVFGPKSQGPTSKFAVIRDPSGAHCALYQR